ncbi:hypothetical protein N0V93_005928 [Gnomoniopsis smithogilvyi]|uniref:Nudix hydrolase domain-containing protein n=1 Tax=Gnomoniopsis smithogilvyi TaxID=1191159 RepID=A0A9W8YVM4_9PEZI|nr:hypothetical protein N0V93_005928 [Gnomoniopsis smithogilvyi]
MATSQSPPDFKFPPSLARFNVPYEDLLVTLNSTLATPLDGLATGAIVFKTYPDDPLPRILLVQRSASDSMPNRWEIPGGGVDPGETILAGAAREVLEESGLVVTEIVELVEQLEHDDWETVEGGYLFKTRRQARIVKFTFVVEVEDVNALKLDPNEHQDSVWATEDECRAKRVARIEEKDLGKGEVALEFTTDAQEEAIYKAFSELRKQKP